MKGPVRVVERISGYGFVFVLAMAGALALGCDATRRDWDTCYQSTCGAGHACTLDHRCVPSVDGGAWDASRVDVPQGIDSAVASAPIDASPMDVSSSVDTSEDVPVSMGPVDGSAGAR